jgi:hypothetical protein
MKKCFELIVQFKFVWGLFFTASILLYSVAAIALGKSSMDFLLIWQFVAITMILTFIHYLIFGEFILKSLSQKYKLLAHFILCYITMLISSNILKWIDITNIYSITVFTGAYTLLYLSMSFSFIMYYKITGEKLNNRLADYKQRKNMN